VFQQEPQPERSATSTSATAPPREGLLLAFALVLVAAVHAGALDGPFIWDDHVLVEEGILEHPRPLLEYVFQPFWRAGESGPAFRGFVRPVTTLSFVFDAAWTHGNPIGFHLTNLVTHVFVAFLLGSLARKLGATPLASAVAALGFGIAPRLTESVTWISGRTDVLAAAFGLSALAIYPLHSLRRTFTRASLRAWVAALLVLLALAAKEIAVAFVALMVADEAVEALRSRGRARQVLVRLVPLFASLVCYAWLRIQTGGAPKQVAEYGAPRALFSLEALGHYALMLVDFARPRAQIGDIRELSRPHVVLGAAVALGIAIAGIRRTRQLRTRGTLESDGVMFGLLLALAGTIPVLHVLPMPMNVVAADRFLYVPLMGLALAGACAASRLRPERRTLATAGMLAALVTAAGGTVVRERAFRSELSFWLTATGETAPSNTLPLRELAGVAYRTGEFELAGSAFSAIAKRDLAIPNPTASSVVTMFTDLSDTYSALGDYDRAAFFSERTLELGAVAPRQMFNAALVQLHREDFAGAARLCREALSMLADYPDARTTLAALPELERERQALASEPNIEPGRRARYFRRIGARLKAQRAYLELLEQPPFDAGRRDEALAYLVGFGDTDALVGALARHPTNSSVINAGALLREEATREVRAHSAEIKRYIARE